MRLVGGNHRQRIPGLILQHDSLPVALADLVMRLADDLHLLTNFLDRKMRMANDQFTIWAVDGEVNRRGEHRFEVDGGCRRTNSSPQRHQGRQHYNGAQYLRHSAFRSASSRSGTLSVAGPAPLEFIMALPRRRGNT